MGQTQAAALGGEPLTFPPELFPLAAQGPALFFRLGGHADDTQGPLIAAQVTVQIQGQFAGIGFVGHHAFMVGIEFLRMHDKYRDAECGELPVEMETARPSFVNHAHLIGQGELFLHEQQETGRGEPLRRLRGLAIAYSDDPEMIGVPVHSEFQLLDSVLRFRFWRRIRFHRHVEFMFDVYCLTDINSCRPLRQLLQHAFFFR